MRVKIIGEHGYEIALLGLGLSHGLTSKMTFSSLMTDNDLLNKLKVIALKLRNKNNGKNKFLESIAVWIDIQAPRYFFQQFDTYRVGMTKQSESIMHTILKRELTPDDFEGVCNVEFIPYFLPEMHRITHWAEIYDPPGAVLDQSVLRERSELP